MKNIILALFIVFLSFVQPRFLTSAEQVAVSPFVDHYWLAGDNILTITSGPKGKFMSIHTKEGSVILQDQTIRDAWISPKGNWIGVFYPGSDLLVGDLKLLDKLGNKVSDCDQGHINRVSWSPSEEFFVYNVVETDNSVTSKVFNIQMSRNNIIKRTEAQSRNR